MQLKNLFKDDDAVSPVIGVILMVAITVILAAVIASFVLGLGDTADEVQPNTNFALDDLTGEGDETAATITLTDGDAIDFEELVIRGSGVNNEDEGGEYALSDHDPEGDGTWNTGQSVEFDSENDQVVINGEDSGEGIDSTNALFDDDGGTVNLVWEEAGGDNSATLFDFEVEEA